MTAFLLYIVKSTLCLTIFYIFFKAILSRDTFFRLNRVLLLGGTCLCLLIPLAKRSPELMPSLQSPLKECNDPASLEAIDLTGADHLTLYSDKNCRMGFISKVCGLLRQKQAQLQIEYEVL